MKDLALPSAFTPETVTKLAVDVLTQLSGADKIDLAYLKGVLAVAPQIVVAVVAEFWFSRNFDER